MSGCRQFAVVFLLGLAGARLAAAEMPLADSTIVVYNKAQADSAALAKFYAQQRGIARDHVIPLECSLEEEISRDEFDSTIAEPLRETFRSRHWWTIHTATDGKETVQSSAIHFVALIRGMPLKIRAMTDYPGDETGPGPIAGRNEASVDSELSLLAFSLKRISGGIPNPYFQSFRGIRDFENSLLLVCRLDAPAATTVRRMITDAVAAEKSGLWGRAYIDGSHGTAPGAELGDKWMKDAAADLQKTGVPVVQEDTPAVFPDSYPMTDCALYYGWYAGQMTGPFNQPDFHFIPGAIAVHIHSFSAGTLRGNSNWAAPLVSRGAAATMGNVYEPYLQLTAHLDIFNDRLLHGFTLAESGYMSLQALSWMSVIVGDPLYRPYGSWVQLDTARDSGRSQNPWKMYHDFAVKNVTKPPAEYRSLARQVAARARNAPMLEDLGLMEARDQNFDAAVNYFQQARGAYTKRDDILRVVLEESDSLIKQGRQKRALDLVRMVLRIVSDAPAAPLLRKIEQDLSGATLPPR